MKVSELIISIGKQFEPNFNLSENTLFETYRSVYDIFSRSLRVKSAKSKGVILLGGVGTGKTLLMRIFQLLLRNTNRSFRWCTATDLKDLVEEFGAVKAKQLYGKDLKCDLYLDDIGVISASFMRYGNATNILAELVLERYELFINEGYKTHFSSNLPLITPPNSKDPSIQKILTERAYDRLREMCAVVSVNGKSLRK